MKEKQKYFVTVRFPCDSSSNCPEVDWYDVEARSEKEAFHKARMKASRRIQTLLLPHPSKNTPNPCPL